MRLSRKLLIAALVLAAAIAAAIYYLVVHQVRIEDYPVPARSAAAPQYAQQESVVVTSVSVPMRELRLGLEKDVPRTLVTINERVDDCVPRETVRLFKKNLFKTPRFGCDLVGNIRRGSISFAQSEGSTLHARMPINATIEIRNIGDIIKRETATATAMVTMRARLGLGRRWELQPDIDLSYEWFEEPGVDFVGQRIRFTRQADAELAKILPKIERQLAAQIAAVRVRPDIEKLWRQVHTVESVNRENPPVWLTLDPEGAGVGAVRIRGDSLAIDVMLRANAGLRVGERPERPAISALPPNEGVARSEGYSLQVPILADYDEVEPVILRALKRLAAKGIANDDLGRLEIDFESVELYATDGGRLAVGVETTVEPIGNVTGRIWGRSRGTVWLTALPISEAGSEIISVRDVEIFGDMDTDVGDLLVRVVSSPEVKAEIETALVEDFQEDYDRVLSKARQALRAIRVGAVTLSFTIDQVRHGKITSTGSGLLMLAEAEGEAAIVLP
ncbi:DUF4403 family protein [Qipengyuania flava]|uniref:DUF4403 family protein n=1 Tax=Qipengyuania flava TaxID=192812 RepID=UPI001C639D7C|nr:DUF4403 family protein [Qipengyuania flava]QYJ08326.1 DUF4403 family protein [Qipengyuania flava]